MTTSASKVPVLFFTVGLPGSGKTTFCRRLMKETGVVHLSRDEVRGRFGPYSPRKEAYVLDWLMAESKGLLLDGQNVIVDATNLTVAHRARICSWAYDLFSLHAYHTRKAAIAFPCSTEVSISRRREEISERTILNMVESYVFPDPKVEGFPVIVCPDARTANARQLIELHIELNTHRKPSLT